MTWKERMVMIGVITTLAVAIWFLWSARQAEAQCPDVGREQILALADVGCVIYDKPVLRSIGVPKKIRKRLVAVVACLGGKRKEVLAFGLDRKGRVRCSGYGRSEGGFEACGLVW